MRVADYVAATLARHGIRHVFMVTGGGAMHLNDAIGRCPELSYVCCHHEQACAMAAESYFRLTNRLAAVNVTTGPGGLNALNGVWGAWVDSLGMIVVSGQVKWEATVRSTGLPLRQLGDQELDITRLTAPITKYSVMVTDPQSIRYHMERALHLAVSGRPGPCWLDIPMNVQGAQVDPAALAPYDPAEDPPDWLPDTELPAIAHQIIERMKGSQRPVILAGSAVRLSGAQACLLQFAERWGIPLVSAWNAHDLVPSDHPCYAGRPSFVGDRPGAFTVQNADFLLALGSRLTVRQVTYNPEFFAREAFLVMVDLDANELRKPTVHPDLPVQAEVGALLDALWQESDVAPVAAHREWLQWCRERVERYPVVLPAYRDKPCPVNPYVFMDQLFHLLPPGQITVTGDGTACVTAFQAATIKPGQRLYTNAGCASMGYDLPAAVGAAVASGQPVVCLAGDGSIQMNLQELQTIVTHQLPVKIFVLNNSGYHSIRQTQQTYFPDNIVGCGRESGLDFPDFSRLAPAYGLPYRDLRTHAEGDEAIRWTLEGNEPRLCEVFLDLEQAFAPKLASRKLPDGRMISSPLEDLYPFLPREELKSNMLIPLVEE